MTTRARMNEKSIQSLFTDLPGLDVRTYRGAGDHRCIRNVFQVCKAVDSIEHTTTLESIDHHFEHLERRDPFRDMIFVEMEDQPVVYARVGWYPEEPGDLIYYSLGWFQRGGVEGSATQCWVFVKAG